MPWTWNPSALPSVSVLSASILALAIGSCREMQLHKTYTVLVDAGHGGRDVGAPAVVKGKFEKDVTLAVARMVAARLKVEAGYAAIMTRTADRYVSLLDRRKLITACKPDLVVSIHANSGPSKAHGASVYALNEAGKAIVVGRLVGHEGQRQDDEDLAYLMADLRQRQSTNKSFQVAYKIQSALRKRGSKSSMPLNANFALLKAPGIPSVLIECGFITNRYDAANLLDADGQTHIANSIVQAIIESK